MGEQGAGQGAVPEQPAGQSDPFRRSLRHLCFIVQSTDDGKTQPWPWCAETAGQRNDTKKNTDAWQDGKGYTGCQRTLQFRRIHSDGDPCFVRTDHEYDTYSCYKGNDTAADQIQRSTV